MDAAHPSALDYIAKISTALSNGALSGARDLVCEARGNFPTHTRLAVLHCNILTEMGETDDALSLLRGLPERVQFGEALLSAVESLQKAGQTETLEQLIKDVPDRLFQTRWVRLARLRQKELSEGLNAAINYAGELSETIPDEPVWLLEHTRLLQKAGRFDQVIRILSGWTATALNPAGITRLANAYLSSSRPKDARILLNQNVGFTKENPGLAILHVKASIDDGALDESYTLANAALDRWPDHPQVRAVYWQALMHTRQSKTAISDCLAFADANVENARATVRSARFLAACGLTDRAIEIVERAQRCLPHSNVLAELGAELTFQAQDAKGAAAQLNEHFNGRPWTDTAVHLLARIEDALGDAMTAFGRLNDRIGMHPPAPASFSLEAAAIGVRIGQFHGVTKLLDEVGALLPTQAARRAMIQAHMALEKGDDSAALDDARKATELAPGMSEAWSFLSQLQLLAGAQEDAVTSHANSIARRLAATAPGERGPKIMSTIQGQIINEFRLLTELPDLALMAPQRDQLDSAHRLRQRLHKHVDSTPLAMTLLNALRREGLIGSDESPICPKGNTNRIPAQVFQFWDDPDLPSQIAEIMSDNRDMNPDWSFRLYNMKSALDYLQERGETRAARAFRSAPHVAAKADIFRLAVLWYEGGLYMDADDRCLTPLSGLVDRRLRHVFYLEPPRTVGNNFIAAQPHSPILRAALDDAVRAFAGPTGEAIWLATGPGAVTRALARLGTDEDGVLQDGIWVMPMHRLRQSVAVHLRLPYKGSSAHWLRQLSQIPE